MSNARTQLDDVVLSFGTPETPNPQSIAREKIRAWLTTINEIEAQGALCSYLLDEEYSSRIAPPLEFSDFHPFVSTYFLRCIRDNPQGEWSDTRYGAGMALANWFKALKDDKTVPRQALVDIKLSIQKLWDSSDEGVRDGILNGALEHIFEDHEARRLFDDWQQHPEYAELYKAACEWQDNMPDQS